MAHASKRATPRESQLRPVYDDDEPSMSLELFGYQGVLVDEDDDDGANLSLPLPFDDNDASSGTSAFMVGGGASYHDAHFGWAYSSGGSVSGSSSSSGSGSSVLSFEQAIGGGRLSYNAGGDDDGALWMDAAVGAVYHVGLVQEERLEAPKQAQKRACPVKGGEAQGGKRQCGGAGRKNKAKQAAPRTKDPQSAAAKVRRERISERLKVLQDLVPNGTKVDLVTMLEKAVNYVKFLQLQVKVLATDEFWPSQGGKAPELSQVKEALDAILSSQRDTSPMK